METISELKRVAGQRFVTFGRDVGNIFQALGIWGIIFLLSELVLGCLPLLVVLTLGWTVDAMIGARGIGVVTSDVNHELTRWLLILVIGFLAYLFSARFTGKAGEVGRGLREIVTFATLLLYLISIHQVFLFLVFSFLLGLDWLFVQFVQIRFANLGVSLFVGSLYVHQLVKFTIGRAFTVGEGLAMIGAIVMFVVCLKLRIAVTSKAGSL